MSAVQGKLLLDFTFFSSDIFFLPFITYALDLPDMHVTSCLLSNTCSPVPQAPRFLIPAVLLIHIRGVDVGAQRILTCAYTVVRDQT